VEPGAETGLRRLSQVMVDRPIAVRRERLGEVIGRVDDATLARVTRVLALWLGIG
jgi:mRNA interferase MazF